jgi:putative DNA primase/helicase
MTHVNDTHEQRNDFDAHPPKTYNGNLEQLPPALEHLGDEKVWVCWKWVWTGVRWTKPPYRTNGPSYKASTSDPETWGSYGQAAAQVHAGNADGIGFTMKGRNIGGVDLDDCRDPDTGEIEGWAQEIVDQFPGAYVEVTVSGEGLRIIGKSELQDFALKFHDKGVELFSNSTHYLTLSCNALTSPATLPPIGDKIKALAERLGAASHQERSNDRGNGHAPPEPDPDDPNPGLNSLALANLDAWVSVLLPSARRSNKGWRVTSASIGRDLEEDISFTPQGIKDFGVHDMGDPNGGKRTPVAIVMEWKRCDESAAIRWLCERLGVPVDDGPPFSEENIAIEFAKRNADSLRYVARFGQWFTWNGACWREDEKRSVYTVARNVCRETAIQSNKSSERKRIASAKTRAAVVSLAGEDPRLAATADQWDTDPWLLNTPDGVVNLRTGQMRAQRPEDYMTKCTTVSPGGDCPKWKKFLEEVTGENKELKNYLQRVGGYCLTGVTDEQELYFFYGTGRNGKSVFLKTIATILGDYHRASSIETFTVSQSDRHPTEVAGLRGARLVTATETEDGRRWSEARIKELTGGDKVSARFMHQDFFDFTPQFKLLFCGNHMPALRTVNQAIRRRFRRVPFTVTISEEKVNVRLAEELMEEAPGILQWLIEGCLEWQRDGLKPPKAVTEATEAYLESQDVLGDWLAECCDVGNANHTETSARLFGSWKEWCEARNEFVGSKKAFGSKLEDHGFEPRKGGQGVRYFSGLRLKP